MADASENKKDETGKLRIRGFFIGLLVGSVLMSVFFFLELRALAPLMPAIGLVIGLAIGNAVAVKRRNG